MGNCYTTKTYDHTGRGLDCEKVGLNGIYRLARDDQPAYVVYGIRHVKAVTKTYHWTGGHTTTVTSEIFIILVKESDKKNITKKDASSPVTPVEEEMSYEDFVTSNPMENPSKDLLIKYAEEHWFIPSSQ